MDERAGSVNLWRPDLEVADRDVIEASFTVEPFELYGRSHETRSAGAEVAITRLQDGVHVDLEVSCEVQTTCDRTLEPVTLWLSFGDSELLSGPSEPELSVEDWVLSLPEYARAALPAELPIQVFAPGSEPVDPGSGAEEIDPRWRGLDGLFASGF